MELGDIVILKTKEGPRMVVVRVRDPGGNDHWVDCTFFTGGSGFRQASFPIEALIKVRNV